jgi:aspartate-semialdehyde dehydrogenase
MNRKPHVAVVGATGAVGIEMIKTLEKRNFPVGKLTLLASSRSVGKKLKYRGQEIAVTELKKDSFAGIDIALFSAGGSISKDYAPIAAQAGCVVIDNSSAFRMDDKVPLVIPEINASDVKWHKGIIANPNCTTAIALMALYPLHAAFTCKRIQLPSRIGHGRQGHRRTGAPSGPNRQEAAGDARGLSAPDRFQRVAAR